MNKKPIRTLSIVALVMVSAALLLGNTYSKYTSTSTGTSSARVALWSFKLNDAAMTNAFTFDLLKTINDTGNAAAETDVSSKSTDVVIAPGTEGSFAIKLENLSEVTAMYGIDFTVTNEGSIPVQFKVDTGDWGALADITADATTTKLDAKTGTKTITVYWKWPYEITDGDAADTTLGTAGTATLTVSADVTVTQVD